jgi:HetE-like protein
MDSITTAIVAVLPALASDMVKSGVKDAYEGLKAVIRRKWGETAPITKAITALEEDPASKAQAAVLEEKVGAVKATEDAEVTQALEALLEEMKAHGVSTEAAASVHVSISGGTQTGIIGAGNVRAETMTFGNR